MNSYYNETKSREIRFAVVGQRFNYEGKSYEILEKYPYNVLAMRIDNGFLESFSVGDLVLCGIEPSEEYRCVNAVA